MLGFKFIRLTLPQSSLKKLSVNTIPGIEEVNMIKDDGSVIHFNNPKVQASLAANTFAVTGHADNKQITELLPGKAILLLRLAEREWQRSFPCTKLVLY